MRALLILTGVGSCIFECIRDQRFVLRCDAAILKYLLEPSVCPIVFTVHSVINQSRLPYSLCSPIIFHEIISFLSPNPFGFPLKPFRFFWFRVVHHEGSVLIEVNRISFSDHCNVCNLISRRIYQSLLALCSCSRRQSIPRPCLPTN